MCLTFNNCAELSTDCAYCVSGAEACPSPVDECFQPAGCIGTIVGEKTAATADSCLLECQKNDSCNYWTYDNSTNPAKCQLFEDCSEVNKTCSTCVLGERTCGNKNSYNIFIIMNVKTVRKFMTL